MSENSQTRKLRNRVVVYNLQDKSRTKKYNLRKRSISEIEPEKIVDNNKKQRIDDTEDETVNWDNFNKYSGKYPYKPWVSATKIKNYLLNDPVLDWYDIYHLIMGLNERSANRSNINKESNNLSVLMEMGNKFEDYVLENLRQKFPDSIHRVADDFKDINRLKSNMTFKKMQDGVPIIEQAVLYNNKNKTFGVADLIIRSDWVNNLFDKEIISKEDETISAPNLSGNYHYRVIDIKWTTLNLCVDGKHIRNSDRFPAYKGQLAVYNAAIGMLQGYTPNEAYILSKSWKYTKCNKTYRGYNCFDLLGVIDYSGFDKKYIEMTSCAVDWIRQVRNEGKKW